MRIRNWALLGLAMIVLTALLLLRINSIHDVVFPAPREEQGHRLTFVCGDMLDDDNISEYWNQCLAGLKAASLETGASLNLLSSNGDYEKLADAYGSAVLSGAEGILCVGVEIKRLGAAIDASAGQGIPTVCLDGDVRSSERIAYVGTDNTRAGAQAAEALLARLDGPGTVVVLYPGFQTPQFRERVEGFCRYFEGRDGYEVFISDRYMTVGPYFVDHAGLLREILTDHPDTVGIFCPGTYIIARIVSQLGSLETGRPIRVACFDDYSVILECIRDGSIDVTVVQDPYQMGYNALLLLCGYLEDGSSALPEDTVYIATRIIDAVNIDEEMHKRGLSS
ncbi:MAG: substrate-binding domain-containing protein [Clostridia bacterium]|nr:substrate-binding domain-containing protein [Clostridia bacterium]